MGVKVDNRNRLALGLDPDLHLLATTGAGGREGKRLSAPRGCSGESNSEVPLAPAFARYFSHLPQWPGTVQV